MLNAEISALANEVWVICEQEGDELDACSSMVLARAGVLARGLPDLVLRVLCRSQGRTLSAKMQECLRSFGVSEAIIFKVNADAWIPEAVQHLVVERKPLALLCPATHSGSELAARLAVVAGLPLVADCKSLTVTSERELTFLVTAAGGMAELEVACSAVVTCIAVMPLDEFTEHEAAGFADRLLEFEATGPKSSDFILLPYETEPVAREDLTLAEATVVVSGGRGLGGPEPFGDLGRLAALLGGRVGASRVATDLGWISRDHLVGVSGSTVRPALYLAFGISGAPHHLMGMRDSTVIVAVNQDSAAPIFQHATHAFVGNLLEVVPGLISALTDEPTA